MLITLRDVPPEERHLLFCSRLLPRRRPLVRPRRHSLLPALNRSLESLGESVDCTWRATAAPPRAGG